MENQTECQLANSGSLKCNIDLNILRNLTTDMSLLIGASTNVSEADLIQNRYKYQTANFLNPNLPICSVHRLLLGKKWKIPTKCVHSKHPSTKNEKRRKVSWDRYMQIRNTDMSFPILGKICTQCFSNAEKSDDDETIDSKDETYEPPLTSMITDIDMEIYRNKLCDLAKSLNIEPCRNVIRSPVNEMSDRTLWYFQDYLKKLTEATQNLFFECAAPGQKEELKNLLSKKSNAKNCEIIPSDINNLVEAYNKCTTSDAKTSVLSMVPKKYRKSDVVDYFKCSLHRVKIARQLVKKFGPCTKPKLTPSCFSRVPKQKIEHFLHFLFNSGILKEEAYGVSTLKFDNGAKIRVSNTIMDSLDTHAIREYKMYCLEVAYDGLGTTSLHCILKVIKPKHRQKVAGVDSFVVEGIESFFVSTP